MFIFQGSMKNLVHIKCNRKQESQNGTKSTIVVCIKLTEIAVKKQILIAILHQIIHFYKLKLLDSTLMRSKSI